MISFEQLLVGRVLAERYRADELLERGGMGAVFRSHDLRLEREVAFKVVTAPPGLSPEARETLRARFQREAKTAASITHPNVVTVHDYGVDPALDLDYLVMELLAGEDLGTRISRGWRPAADELAGILAQAADGLAAGHVRGVVHRDVKPGNLFLTGARVKVLDFGIAQPAAAGGTTVTHLTGGGANPHTPRFAAPEQLVGERATPATDVYALGLTGVAAYAGSVDDPAAAVDLLARESPVLAAVLRRALNPDPAQRFPDCAAMADALHRVAGGAPRAAVRRPKRGLAILAALGVLVLALSLWRTTRTPPAPPESEAEALAAARAVFREVNAGAGRMTRRYNANGRVMAYLDRTGVRKLVTRDPPRIREEYFDAHGLRFAYERSGASVHRYYFTAQGTLARHLGLDPPGTAPSVDWNQRARALRARAEQSAAAAPKWPTQRCPACDSLP